MKRILLTTIVAFCISYTTAQPTAGLVAYWPMNGNFSDLGPNSISVTNTGATATTNKNGVVNTAMLFANNINVNTATIYAASTINPAINFSQSASFTISHFFKINALNSINPGGASNFFDNNLNYGGYGIWVTRSGVPSTGNLIQIIFCVGNFYLATLGTTTPINLNTWYHLTAVKDGSNLILYINGIQVATNTGTFSVPTYTYQPKFGTFWFNGTGNYSPLNGALDELRIYNRALTPAEIANLAVLPIKLSSFTATNNNDDVLLQWQTEYEQNSSHFDIQRSTDGINFSSVGTVQAKGNSSLKTQYQITDNTAKNLGNAKTVFYRLEMVDIDARKENSAIVAVKLNTDKKELTILQNPAGNNLRIQFTSSAKEAASIIITDATGRQLLTKQIQLNIGNISTAIPVNMLAAGNYYITVICSRGKQTETFFKQ